MRREAGEDFQPFVARIRLQLKVPTPLRLAVASWFCQIGGARPGRGHGGVRPRAVIMTTVQKSVPDPDASSIPLVWCRAQPRSE